MDWGDGGRRWDGEWDVRSADPTSSRGGRGPFSTERAPSGQGTLRLASSCVSYHDDRLYTPSRSGRGSCSAERVPPGHGSSIKLRLIQNCVLYESPII